MSYIVKSSLEIYLIRKFLRCGECLVQCYSEMEKTVRRNLFRLYHSQQRFFSFHFAHKDDVFPLRKYNPTPPTRNEVPFVRSYTTAYKQRWNYHSTLDWMKAKVTRIHVHRSESTIHLYVWRRGIMWQFPDHFIHLWWHVVRSVPQ